MRINNLLIVTVASLIHGTLTCALFNKSKTKKEISLALNKYQQDHDSTVNILTKIEDTINHLNHTLNNDKQLDAQDKVTLKSNLDAYNNLSNVMKLRIKTFEKFKEISHEELKILQSSKLRQASMDFSQKLTNMRTDTIKLMMDQKKILNLPIAWDTDHIKKFKDILDEDIRYQFDAIKKMQNKIDQRMLEEVIVGFVMDRNETYRTSIQAIEERQKKLEAQEIKKIEKYAQLITAHQEARKQHEQVQAMLAHNQLVTENPLANETADLKRTLELQAEEKAQKDAKIEENNRLLAQQAKIVSSAHPHALHQLDLQHQQEQPAAPAAPIAAPYSLHALGNFRTWLDTLSPEAQKTINERIERMSRNDFGDSDKIAGTHSLWELRIRRKKQAYRLYYTQEGNIITLVWGGNKKTQDQDIEIAKKYVKDSQ